MNKGDSRPYVVMQKAPLGFNEVIQVSHFKFFLSCWTFVMKYPWFAAVLEFLESP